LGFVPRFERCFVQRFDATPHQNDIDGKPIQPSGKCSLRPKCLNSSKYLKKDLLREILRKGRIPCHSKAKPINTSAMRPGYVSDCAAALRWSEQLSACASVSEGLSLAALRTGSDVLT